MIKIENSSRINAFTSDEEVAKEARRLVDIAYETNSSYDAWRVVQFLHDFPNALVRK